MSAIKSFKDGLVNFVNDVVNLRNPLSQNEFYSQRLKPETLRQTYKTGIGNKIVRLKAGRALKNTLQFESDGDKEFYRKRLEKNVKIAARWMVATGRGLIVLHHRGDDLSKPIGEIDENRIMMNVFSGDMVTVGDSGRDLQAERYLKPIQYNVRGKSIHYSRVVDFTYVQPPEMEAPQYMYGGISEFELIYDQLIADGIVQRASPKILEKASTLFYKVTGFKDAMRTGQEKDMVDYFSKLENVRGISSAGIIDAEDELEVISMTLSNLADADQITLRRLAMVTGIPLSELIGENVKGLNSTGDNERQSMQDMIELVQSEYLDDPINELMAKFKKGVTKFKENQSETPESKISYESKAIDNAVKLQALGEDYGGYLIEKGITTKDDYTSIFGDSEPDGE